MHSLLAQRIAGVRPSFIREILKVSGQPGIISFAGGLPNQALFPLPAIQAASQAVLASDGRNALQYSTTEGHTGLREWISARYHRRFGLDIPIESILITNGSQQALDLLGKVLLDAGDGVVVEEPGYLGAIQAFSLYRPHFLPVPLREEGLDTQVLRTVLAEHRPKLSYCVPNFQNPSGISYSREKRHEVAELLAQHHTLLIEDDPYGELRFEGKEAASFHTLLPGQTILLGSFSKTVLPAFRLGWIIAPAWLMEKLVIAKQSADLHSSGFTQRILHRYLSDNDYDAHLSRLIDIYGKQRQAMLAAIEQHFPTQVSHTRPEGGMFLWATLPEHVSAMTLFTRAIKQQVAFVPGHPFYIDRDDSRTLRLNYTHADTQTIERGIKRLGKVIREFMAAPDQTRPLPVQRP